MGVAIIFILISVSVTAYFYFQQEKIFESQKKLLRSWQKKAAAISVPKNDHVIKNYQSLKNALVEIEGFRKSRIELSEKLLRLIEKTPFGISLLKLSISEKEIILEGYANRKSSLEVYMRNLSNLFKRKKFRLKIIETTSEIRFTALILTEKIS